MKIVVLGAGAVGGYYGGQLARAGHDVIVVARGRNLEAIRARGLEIRTSEGTFRADVRATDGEDVLAPADFAILAVKSYVLADIAPLVRRYGEQETTVVPLLNGVETAERLQALGVPASAIIGGLTRISAVRVDAGIVERRSPFQVVVVGERDGHSSERVERIVAAFRDAGADARASAHIEIELWQKFVFIAALAAACGLTGKAVGAVRADAAGRRLLQGAIEEVVAVAHARGIALANDEAARVLAVIDSLPADTKPSFLVDLEAGRPTELDVLSGTVARFAQQAGIDAPVHRRACVDLAHGVTV